jgi:hypothetical protein
MWLLDWLRWQVQPIVGYYSDRCTSKMGRRRPFILAGCIIICLSVSPHSILKLAFFLFFFPKEKKESDWSVDAGGPAKVLMIGFSADIGRRLGDTTEHCSTFTGSRWYAAAVYIVGFWFLDFANNTVQVHVSNLLYQHVVFLNELSRGSDVFLLASSGTGSRDDGGPSR